MPISDTSSQDVQLTPKSNPRLVWLGIAALVLLSIAIWLVAPTVQRWTLAQDSVSGERLRLAEV